MSRVSRVSQASRLLVLVAALLVGCAISAKRMVHLSVGMSKPEVKKVLGAPRFASATTNVEVWRYHLGTDVGLVEEYFVEFSQGIVSRYGRFGDFGTAQDPGLRLKLDTQ